jgi:hypothetical protein
VNAQPPRWRPTFADRTGARVQGIEIGGAVDAPHHRLAIEDVMLLPVLEKVLRMCPRQALSTEIANRLRSALRLMPHDCAGSAAALTRLFGILSSPGWPHLAG